MIKLEKVNKYYNKGKKNQIHVIDNVSLSLESAGLVALLGPSGCGKTTLLNVIGGLDKIKKGKIYINDERISKKRANKVDKIRNLKIGYIFQDYKLIDNLTVFENVAIVLKMIGIKDKKEIKKRVDYVLETLNIYRYRHRLASMLSGGERQRVAIARAIVKDPEIILADEPTGNLDSKNTIEIMNIIKSISKNRLVILVTHEVNLAKFYSDRIIEIEDGKIIKDYKNENKDNLDYRIENNIYLKDLKYHEKLNEIDLYKKDKKKLDLTLAVVDGSIYIENKENYKIEVVDNSSNIKLINDHYKEIDRNEIDKYEFNSNNIINNNFKKKYTSIFNLFSFLTSGFKKILNYSFIKKLLLLGYMASSMFIILSVSRIMTTSSIKDKDFVQKNKNYIVVNKSKFDKEDYNNLMNLNTSKIVVLGDSIVNFEVTYNTLMQNYEIYYDQISGSISPLSGLKEEDIITGKIPTNKYELAIDKLVLDKLFTLEGSAISAGIKDINELIGTKLKINNMKDFKIVGITNNESPRIYANDDVIFDIIYNSQNDIELKYQSINNYEYNLVKGRNPENNYEVLVPDNMKDIYSLNTKLEDKINKTKLKVVGYYENNNYDNNFMLVNQDTLLEYYLTTKTNIKSALVYSENKESTIDELNNLKYNAKDNYEVEKKEYINEKKESIKSSLIASGTILAISLIEIYLMIRSSFLSRIKEVGIYRAIGVKKKDIYIMFLGEILAITLSVSNFGIILMSYIIYNISKMKFIGNMVVLNPKVIIISVIIIYAFNIIFGLLPVRGVIKKTPSEILSRNDI